MLQYHARDGESPIQSRRFSRSRTSRFHCKIRIQMLASITCHTCLVFIYLFGEKLIVHRRTSVGLTFYEDGHRNFLVDSRLNMWFQDSFSWSENLLPFSSMTDDLHELKAGNILNSVDIHDSFEKIGKFITYGYLLYHLLKRGCMYSYFLWSIICWTLKL